MANFREALMPFWGRGAKETTSRKAKDKEVYDEELRKLFERNASHK